MIVELIITWFADLAVWIFDLFPDWTPPDASSWAESASSVWSFVGWSNQYVPVDIALLLIGTALVVYVGSYLLKLTLWVFTKLHILGGSDS